MVKAMGYKECVYVVRDHGVASLRRDRVSSSLTEVAPLLLRRFALALGLLEYLGLDQNGDFRNQDPTCVDTYSMKEDKGMCYWIALVSGFADKYNNTK